MDATPAAPAAKSLSPRKPRRAKARIENLSGLLDQLCTLVDCGAGDPDCPPTVTGRAIVDTIGRRAYGPLLLALGLFSISPLTAVPGMTWASALLTLIMALQLTFGMKHPWLPRRLMDAPISADGLVKAIGAVRPWARRIDVVLKPRLHFLARPPFVMLIGLFCVAAALVTFPLGFIPFAPIAPGLAIVLFGLGLVARDGLMLTLGAIGVGGAGYLAMTLVNRIPWF